MVFTLQDLRFRICKGNFAAADAVIFTVGVPHGLCDTMLEYRQCKLPTTAYARRFTAISDLKARPELFMIPYYCYLVLPIESPHILAAL
jgi:hypothetical protein